MPNYIISWSTNKVILRNYEGVITSYKEPDSYEPVFCNRKCDECRLHLELDEAEESHVRGIEKLLSDHDKTYVLNTEFTERVQKREE
jgi:lysine 2,3-aminomutase